jgi:hypothetical protein
VPTAPLANLAQGSARHPCPRSAFHVSGKTRRFQLTQRSPMAQHLRVGDGRGLWPIRGSTAPAQVMPTDAPRLSPRRRVGDCISCDHRRNGARLRLPPTPLAVEGRPPLSDVVSTVCTISTVPASGRAGRSGRTSGQPHTLSSRRLGRGPRDLLAHRDAG